MRCTQIEFLATTLCLLILACPCHSLILNVWSNSSSLGCNTLTCSETTAVCTITQSSPDEGQTIKKSYQCLDSEGELTAVEEEEDTNNDDGFYASIKVEARKTEGGANEDPEKVILVNDGTLLICDGLTCIKPAKMCHVVIETTQESAEKVERITTCLAADGVVLDESKKEVKNTYSTSGFYIRIENVLVAADKNAANKMPANKKVASKKMTGTDNKAVIEPAKADMTDTNQRVQSSENLANEGDTKEHAQSLAKSGDNTVIDDTPKADDTDMNVEDEADTKGQVQSSAKSADKKAVYETPKADATIVKGKEIADTKGQTPSSEKPSGENSNALKYENQKTNGNKFMCGKLECPEMAMFCVITKKTQPGNSEYIEYLMECLNESRKMVRDLKEIIPNPDPTMSVEEKAEKKRPASKPKPFECGSLTCSADTDQCVITHYSISGFWAKMDTSIHCLDKSGKILQHLTKREDSPNNETFINTCVRIYRNGRVSHMNATFSSGDGRVNNLPLAFMAIPRPLCPPPPPPPTQPPHMTKFSFLSEPLPIRYPAFPPSPAPPSNSIHSPLQPNVATMCSGHSSLMGRIPQLNPETIKLIAEQKLEKPLTYVQDPLIHV